MNISNKGQIFGIIAIVLAALQVVLVIVSWLLSAAMPDLMVRSLLGSEGFRWFFGHFAENLSNSVLVDILLLVIGGGAVVKSGLLVAVRRSFSKQQILYLEKAGLWTVFIELVAFAVVIILLTAVPHAVLLSVTGHLFPSSFSENIIPIVAFILLVCSLTFGVVSGHLTSIGAAFNTMTYGIKACSWFLPLYILAVELFKSMVFVFPQLAM